MIYNSFFFFKTKRNMEETLGQKKPNFVYPFAQLARIIIIVI